MNVIVTVSRGKEATYMKTFTIDNDNNIGVFASKKEAAAASTPSDPFVSQSELAELAAAWPASRLVQIWNGIPGVTAVTRFTNRKVATERIWKAIQNLGAVAMKPEAAAAEPVTPEVRAVEIQPEPAIVEATPKVEAQPILEVADEAQVVTERPEAETESEPTQSEAEAIASAQAAEVAPVPAPSAPKPARRKKATAEPKAIATREGSKTAQVVAMLQREGGATLVEIMEKMAWQKHTVRGFMAGAMKKAGYAVESFKPESGERTYRITKWHHLPALLARAGSGRGGLLAFWATVASGGANTPASTFRAFRASRAAAVSPLAERRGRLRDPQYKRSVVFAL